MTEETKAEFIKFKRDLEKGLDLGRNLTQDEFVRLLCKYKRQILDVILNTELCERDEKSQEQSQPVEALV